MPSSPRASKALPAAQPEGPLSIAPTRVWQLAEIRAAEYNANVMTAEEEAQLDTSLEEFGMVEDLVVNTHPDRYGVLVGGHRRHAAAVRRGQVSLPAKEVSLTLDRERELNTRLNANRGRLDPQLLLAGGFRREELAGWGVPEATLEAYAAAAAAAAQSVGRAAAERFAALAASSREAAAAEPATGGQPAQADAAEAGAGEFRTLLVTGPAAVIDRCRAALDAQARRLGTTQAGALLEVLRAAGLLTDQTPAGEELPS